MSSKDVRWIQRFSNLKKAVGQLNRFIDKGELNELEKQGLIQAFEYTYELAWNTIKDFYEAQAETGIQGSKDAIRMAFNRGLIENGETWMKMVTSRTLSSHTYNEELAEEIVGLIKSDYIREFGLLRDRLLSYESETLLYK
jgi:nucleotidyltransferase substrate binding protein (TIGR01987 family)